MLLEERFRCDLAQEEYACVVAEAEWVDLALVGVRALEGDEPGLTKRDNSSQTNVSMHLISTMAKKKPRTKVP